MLNKIYPKPGLVLINSRTASTRANVVVAGGGAGGLSVAASLCRQNFNVTVIEPSEIHYYQPLWTLVGAGLDDFTSSHRLNSQLIPKNAKWIKQAVKEFRPDGNTVVTSGGEEVHYDVLVVALGLTCNFNKVGGMQDALENDAAVCSNYGPKYVKKTFPAICALKGGKAIFHYPPGPVKCPGAPQKIMYLADSHFRKNKVRDKIDIDYYSAIGKIFGVEKYANSLWKVINDRDIDVHLQHELIKVDHVSREVVFRDLASSDQTTLVKKHYDFLHVVPSMSAPDPLKNSQLADVTGMLDVNKHTMQSVKYPNVFGLGDCTNTPNSKTAAAVTSQSKALKRNVACFVQNSTLDGKYMGYASCPLVTSHNKCILAEFDYTLKPVETFPCDQGKERYSMFYLKSKIMPVLYWNFLLKGYWEGPEPFRRLFALFRVHKD